MAAEPQHRTLTDADVEAIARRVVELQGEMGAPAAAGRVDAATAAQILGVKRDYVYRHAAELGAERLPSEGGQGRLRFDVGRLLERADCTAGSSPGEAANGGGQPRQAPARRSPKRQRVALLPVRGDHVA